MSSDIQFGDLEQSEPQRAIRPDQDAHFVIANVGEIAAGELPIYVDLDVMRDMEAHAQSNTRVELGGVMLGHQQIDDAGNPFVVVTDSLRALHYEATKGSFKFTHDTWSQITRERDEFRPELEMIGWYHTHPGWSVFLSGMDLFICDNFFNRPLDVALVIDPCSDDRGWFQWTGGPKPKTSRTAGFFLTTGRYREQELNHFARMYNKEPITMHDPRYAGGGHGGGNQPVVNVMETRRPIFEIAIMGMLLMQFLLISLLAWRFLTPATTSDNADDNRVAAVTREIDDMKSSRLQETRDEAYQEVLQSIVSGQTGEHNIVSRLTTLRTTNAQLQANVEAQMALAEKLNRENQRVGEELQVQKNSVNQLNQQLTATGEKLDNSNSQLRVARASTTSLPGQSGSTTNAPKLANATTAGGDGIAWWWIPLTGVVAAGVGGLSAFTLGRKLGSSDEDEFDNDQNDDRETDSFADSDDGAVADPKEPAGDVTVRIVDGKFDS